MRYIFALFVPLMLLAFSKSSNNAILLQQKNPNWCIVCGMNLKKFYKTNYAVKLKDGSYHQYCSMHCLAQEYPKINPKEILAVDAKSGKFIDAKSAYYVVGSRIKGTMSPVSKIAFAKKEDALAFAKEYGGEVKRFDEVFKEVKKDLKEENELIKKKKKFMMSPMGKMLYSKYCKKDISKEDFKNIAELKEYLSKLCPPKLSGKKLQALAVYIWDEKESKRLDVPKDAKCPVCGMFVAKYPKWATMAKIYGKVYYFDGVKDMMKFLQDKNAKRIVVSDYYTLKAIDGKKAYYVVGSDVLGPMGKELIPFKSKEEANSFIKEHGGKIVEFDDINKEVLKELE